MWWDWSLWLLVTIPCSLNCVSWKIVEKLLRISRLRVKYTCTRGNRSDGTRRARGAPKTSSSRVSSGSRVTCVSPTLLAYHRDKEVFQPRKPHFQRHVGFFTYLLKQNKSRETPNQDYCENWFSLVKEPVIFAVYCYFVLGLGYCLMISWLVVFPFFRSFQSWTAMISWMFQLWGFESLYFGFSLWVTTLMFGPPIKCLPSRNQVWLIDKRTVSKTNQSSHFESDVISVVFWEC